MAVAVISRYPRDVRHRNCDQALQLSHLKRFMAEMFRADILVPDDIADDEPLTGTTFDLDSLDMRELAICVEEEFGIAISCAEESRIICGSVSNLADFIHGRTEIGQARRLPVSGRFASGAVRRHQVGPFAQGSVA
jgi:acyl carrier protein